MAHYVQLEDDANNNNNHVTFYTRPPGEEIHTPTTYHNDYINDMSINLPPHYHNQQRPTPSQQQLARLLYQQQKGQSVKALGRANANCCVRYCLSTGLLILLCCSFTLLGMGVVMVRMTTKTNMYPGHWHKDICHVPNVEEDPDYSTQFFAPCKRGFQCNLCHINKTMLTYFDPNHVERTVVRDLVAHDISQEQCMEIVINRRFNCVFQTKLISEDPKLNQITETIPQHSASFETTPSIEDTVQSLSTTTTTTTTHATQPNKIDLESSQTRLADDPTPTPPSDHTIEIIARDEYNLDYNSQIKQFQSAIVVFAMGLFLLMVYFFLVLYRCCISGLQRRYKCLRFLSPKFLCTWILYHCCFKQALEGELSRRPELSHQALSAGRNAKKDQSRDIQDHNSRYNIAQNVDDIWAPKADVVMDEGNDSHFQFDLESSDEEVILAK